MTKSKHFKLELLGLFLCMFFVNIGFAQNSNDAKEVTNTYYIKNAFVVQKPGMVLPNTSVLIKDGLIQSVGPNVEIPFDAKVIDADSMYVYAGFIDACSHAGIKEEEKKDRPRVKNPGNPPKKLAGITPQKTVREAIGEKLDKSMAELRDLGFGFVHVVPRGRMLPGQGSILTTGSGATDETLVKENTSLFTQFKPARGMFPATTIGVMSQFRDLYKNAEYSNTYLKSYNMQPKGLTKPNHSAELGAMFPVVNKQMPVFFYTAKVRDVNRALILNNELGFKMVLTGVRQGWPLMDEIVAGKHSVVLSMHLPEKIEDPEEEKEEDKEDAEKEEKSGEKEEGEKKKEKKKKKKKKEEDPALAMMKAKKKKSHDEYVGQAALFEKKGIAFSLSSLDTKTKEIKPNLLRMVEGGLSEKGALAALTTNPASLLGISNVAGTVEQGKIANIFITDKSFFDKESKIKYVFNDGGLKEFKEKKKKKKGSKGDDVSVIGTWNYTVEVPNDTQTGIMIVDGSDDNLTIRINSADEPEDFVDATNIDLDGNNLTFDINVEGIPYSIDVTLEGTDFEGSVSVAEFGSFPMTGSLKDGPK
ncbi:MAG: amidohydrolase family protein [Saprospiraceae bacterium]|nr:amidohydrolase family protein [Saprospiraceae bacterium]